MTRCWANDLFIIMAIILSFLTLLSACGAKGPLYMVEPEVQKEQQKTADKPIASTEEQAAKTTPEATAQTP